MAKDPTPNADRLRVQREERYGHLQATAETPAGYIEGAKPKAPVRKLIPYAGQTTKGVAPTGSVPAPRKPRKSGKAKRRTQLPPEKGSTDV